MERIKLHRFDHLILLSIVVAICYYIPSFVFANNVSTSLTYQGRIIMPDGVTPLEAASVTFTLQVRSPDVNDCVLYEESHNINMTGSNGLFSLTLGSGTRGGDDPGLTFGDIFSNSSNFAGPLVCGTNNFYNPVSGDVRKLRIDFDDGGGVVAVTPDMDIQSVPYALYANRLGGRTSTEFIQTNTSAGNAVSQSNLETAFSTTNFTELMDLINGTSSNYLQSTPTSSFDLNNQRIINVAAPTTATDAVNKNYTDTNVGGVAASVSGVGPAAGDGKVLTWVQANNRWEAVDPAAVTVDGADIVSGTINKDRLPSNINATAMDGNLDLQGNDLNNSGNITLNGQKYLHLGAFTNTEENNLITVTLIPGGATYRGVTWYNSDTGQIRYWDGLNDVVAGSKIDQLGVFLNYQPNGTECGDGQILEWDDANDRWVCGNDDAATAGTIVDGGNALAQALDIGTTDANDLNFVTSNINRMSISSAGVISLSGATSVTGDVSVTGAISSTTTMTSGGNLTVQAESELRLNDNDNSNHVGFKALNDVTNTQIWTLPDGDGAGGTVLSTNGSGVLSWIDPSAGDVPTTRNINSGTGLTGGGSLSSDLTINVGGGAGITANADDLAIDLVDTNSGLALPGNELSVDITGTTVSPEAIAAGDEILIHDVTLGGLRKMTRANFLNGTGTVTSVDLSAPAIFSVTGGPVTGSGTLNMSLASQSANRVWASPDGSAGTPTFRSLATNDIPNLDAAKITSGTLPLTRGGTGATTQSTAANNILPSQATHAGKFLTTDGTNASWATSTGADHLGNHTATQNIVLGTNFLNGDADNEGLSVDTSGVVSTSGNMSVGGAISSTTTMTSGGNLTVQAESELRLNDNDNSNHVGFKALNNVTNTQIWTLPDGDGGGGTVLSTNGSGVLSWIDPSAGDVPTSRTITSGTGMSGGGNLGSNLTLNVGGGAGITANADDLAIDLVDTNSGLALPGNELSVDITGTTVSPEAIASGDEILIHDITLGGLRKMTRANFLNGTGTVTSVDLSAPAIFSVTGGPVTGSGTLNMSLASQSANRVWASPDGSAGAPAFRSLASNDIPNLSAAKITSGTLPLTRGGTGATTQNAAANNILPAQATHSGKFLTTDGTNSSWATVAGDDMGDHIADQNIVLGANFLNGDADNEGLSVSTTGVVSTSGNLSVGGAVSSTTTMTSGGNLTVQAESELRLNDNDNSNHVGFKALNNVTNTQIWTLPDGDGGVGTVLSTNGSGLLSWIDPSAGDVPTTRTVDSGDGLTGGGALSSNLTLNVVGGSGIVANADDIAIDLVNSNSGLALPGNELSVDINGTTVSPEAIASGDEILIHDITLGGLRKMTRANFLNGTGTVTSVDLSAPAIFSVTGGPVTESGTLNMSLASQSANRVWASPDGSAGAPTFRSLAANDIPNLDAAKIASGTLPLARGGTGATTQAGAANNILPSQATHGGKFLTTDGTNTSWATVPGDNLGNHTATQNIQIGTHYISGDGDNEGIRIDASGNVGMGGVTAPTEALEVTGTVKADGFLATSDRRTKTNIETSKGMSIVNRLRGVIFDWVSDGSPDSGVIAQELEEVLPSLVRTDAEGYKSVRYLGLIAPLIEGTKEIYQMCEASEKQINEMAQTLKNIARNVASNTSRIEELEKQNKELVKMNEKLMNQIKLLMERGHKK